MKISSIHVISREGCFYSDVPESVRQLGPWHLTRRGEIEHLQARYRRLVARFGWALEHVPLSEFSAEGLRRDGGA